MARSSSYSSRRVFWSVVTAVLAIDVVTKLLAHQMLPIRVPHPVMDQDWLRLTLVYNRGAAFGLHLGHDAVTRIVFTVLTLVALVILWKLFTSTREGERIRIVAVALVFAGAIGNLIDRLRWSQGVVDFIDIGIDATRWPTFNVADMAVTTGAISLALVLWREESRQQQELMPPRAAGAPLSESGGEPAI
jgi:signal peptidase II